MPEVAGDAAVYVDPYSVESIAIGLDRILSSSTLRSNLSKQGLRNATRFSWDKAAKQTIKVFKSTISK
jgi:glycosyltransferase involved in cell wall biosynthesis